MPSNNMKGSAVHGSLLWHSNAPPPPSGVGDVVDAIIARAGPKRRRNTRAPEQFRRAVESGSNPLFVSMQPNDRLTSRKGRSRSPRRKRPRPDTTQNPAHKTSHATKPLRENDVQHTRRVTAARIRAQCGGTTRPVALLQWRHRHLRHRTQAETSNPRPAHSSSHSEAMTIWNAAGTILQARIGLRYQLAALSPLRRPVLRAVPLFGMAVTVEKWGSGKRLVSRLGVVLHESALAVTVLLLRQASHLPTLTASTAERKAQLERKVPRLCRVAKAFPGGTGTEAEWRRKISHDTVGVCVAPQEAEGEDNVFAPLVGRYL